MSKILRILQISDLHLLQRVKAKFLGLDVTESFKAVMGFVGNCEILPAPSLVILSGDLAHDGSRAAYLRIDEICQKFTCPVLAIPGNHDRPEVMYRALSEAGIAVKTRDFTLGSWRILLLNSYWPGEVAGRLDAGELAFLRKALQQSRSRQQPTMIFLHHQVLPLKCEWLDRIGLSNSSEFLTILKEYPQVKIVASGHVHQERSISKDGIVFLTVPSTSCQFAVNSPYFRLDAKMPGYRYLDLDADRWHSGVQRIPFDEKFLPDLSSTGY